MRIEPELYVNAILTLKKSVQDQALTLAIKRNVDFFAKMIREPFKSYLVDFFHLKLYSIVHRLGLKPLALPKKSVRIVPFFDN